MDKPIRKIVLKKPLVKSEDKKPIPVPEKKKPTPKKKIEKSEAQKKREANLKPFKKGESGNPEGRPKGIRNRSTIAKYWLETSQTLRNPITGVVEELSQGDIMTLALIKEARSGNVRAYKELMDSAFGKALDNGGEEMKYTVSFKD